VDIFGEDKLLIWLAFMFAGEDKTRRAMHFLKLLKNIEFSSPWVLTNLAN